MLSLPKITSVLQNVGREIESEITRQVLFRSEIWLAQSAAATQETLHRSVLTAVEGAMNTLAQRYAAEVLGAAPSQRVGQRPYRSGVRSITVGSPFGPLTIELTKTRSGVLRPNFLQGAKRLTQGMSDLARRLWTAGLSCRDISSVAKESLGDNVSHTTVDGWVQDAHEEVIKWINRPISNKFRYLMLDGLWISVKRQTARKEVLLVAIGITEDGHREVLDVLPAASESTVAWTTLLARLRGRGLDPKQLRLVVTDGNEGLMRSVDQELSGAPRQRCTVHKIRNVVGTSPSSLKAIAPKEVSLVWKAPNKAEARARQAEFVLKYSESHPKMAAILDNDFEATLSFYDLDANLWASLRSTNVIERFNRELRRKFDEMGACNGDVAVARTGAMVAMKTTADWEGGVVKGFKKPQRRRAHP